MTSGNFRHARLRLGFGMAWLLFGSAAVSGGTPPDPLRATFEAPLHDQRPFVRWWWPGGDVEPGKLDGHLQALEAAGFGGVEIQPFVVGLPPAEVLAPGERNPIHDYATERFFGHVAGVAQTANDLGLTVDYTLGSAWPAGGVEEITPALALRELAVSVHTVHGPGPMAGALKQPQRTPRLGTMIDRMSGGPSPGAAEQMRAQEKIVAVLAYRGSAPQTAPHSDFFGQTKADGLVEKPGVLDPASVVVLTERLREDGTLDWEVPAGEWQVLVFKRFVADMRVAAAAGRGTKYVVDHLNRHAFEVFAERVFGRGEAQLQPHAGRTVRALFIDSLELEVDTYWSDDFLAQFQRRRGYDLLPLLPAIIHPGWEISYHSYASAPLFDLGAAGPRVRADYRLTLSELMLENFYAPLEDYARRHGLVSRVQVHGAPVDLLRGYGLATIPETESMDPATRPQDVDLHLARSAAHIYGRRLVAAESMCWKGNPFAPTPEAWKRRADYFFVLGVNQLVYHGAPYPYREAVRPGWHPFSAPYDFSSYFSPDHPAWPFLGTFNAYVARMQSVLQQTTPASAVAIYRARLGGGAVGEARPEQAVAERLAGAGFQFDLLNADGLLRSVVNSGRLQTPGGATYTALIMPAVEALRAEVAERVAELAGAGLPVFFADGVPGREEGWLEPDRRDIRVREAVKTALGTAHGELVPSGDLVEALHRAGVAPNLTFVRGGAVPFIEKRAGDRTVYFLYNPDAADRRLSLEVPLLGGVERWDPWTGKVAPLAVSPGSRGLALDLGLAPGESALLILNPRQRSEEPSVASPAVKRELPVGVEGWDFHGRGYGREGRPIEVSERHASLRDWCEIDSVRDLAGQGTYRTTVTLSAGDLGDGQCVRLDLGRVCDLAAVKVNGRSCATLLMPPFIADVTDALSVGENRIEVTVANSPNNALAGRSIAAPIPGLPLKSPDPRPAGLLGPVRLIVSVGGTH